MKINGGFDVAGRIEKYMWLSSPSCAVLRRQLFLIRTLGASYTSRTSYSQMERAHCSSISTPEADAEGVIRRITPVLDRTRYKGQAGRIAIIGGCREYTGAPYFTAISALKIGADLSHVFCTKDAATVIKSYSPELIVHPILEESYSIREDERETVTYKILTEIRKWLERFDCIVVGPGLGRDPFLLNCVSDIMRHARQLNIPTVIDADGLFLVTNNIDLVKDNSLAVLTPNKMEYKRLLEKILNSDVSEDNPSEQLRLLSQKIGGATILRKGKEDLISDAETVTKVSTFGSPRRCGGQGDILSGSVAVFTSWARNYVMSSMPSSEKSLNPLILGCVAGSILLRKAATAAFASKKRATLTTDIIEFLGDSLEEICPAD
ncbi:ATP-dependent (S)-NAD(P)H-hydrate dehydratase [Carex littledalei]|uniref:ATP-dependent (S)-NAD(P)H-hydrate dehydratase n=1 Tax=Carex littledalei TaxID=544730 RepID=A0A833R7N8_9POAL|nr:ATP-dependent (S)-NAD(P)H-hydrate dehydratase [Carex littledalei]